MTLAELKALVRTIPDHPAEGILFRDITPLIAHAEGLGATVDHLVERAQHCNVAAVAGVEARGFIFGAAVAARLRVGFVPLRKAGKLPVPTIGIGYDLEYGAARIELDPGALTPGERVLLIDDLLATGGTAVAGAQLLRQAGALVDHALFVIHLPELRGSEALQEIGVAAEAFIGFEGH